MERLQYPLIPQVPSSFLTPFPPTAWTKVPSDTSAAASPFHPGILAVPLLSCEGDTHHACPH